MKKEYKWDIKDLLTKLYYYRIGYDFSDELAFSYDNIKEMLTSNISIGNKKPYLLLKTTTLKDILNTSINDYSTEFQRKIILDNAETTDIENNLSTYYDVLNKKISLEEQIYLIEKTFGRSSELINAHKNMFNKEKHLLKITERNEQNFFSHTNKLGYISNTNNETIDSFLSLSHEIGHYDEFITTRHILDSKIYISHITELINYTEVYSLFYELIATSILTNEGYITKEEAKDCMREINETNANKIKNYLYVNSLININNFNFSNSFFLRKLDFDIVDLATYYYSYLIAITLFENYLRDPEKTMFQTEYLLQNITVNNEEDLLHYCDIDVSKGVLKHMQNLKKKS